MMDSILVNRGIPTNINEKLFHQDIIDNVGDFMNDFYGSLSSGKGGGSRIMHNATNLLSGANFVYQERDKNIAWKMQCAHSLREVLHFWENRELLKSAYIAVYKKGEVRSEKKLTDNERRIFDLTWLYFEYIQYIAHQNYASILRPAQLFKDDNTLEIPTVSSDEFFVESCQEYIKLLESFRDFALDKTKR